MNRRSGRHHEKCGKYLGRGQLPCHHVTSAISERDHPRHHELLETVLTDQGLSENAQRKGVREVIEAVRLRVGHELDNRMTFTAIIDGRYTPTIGGSSRARRSRRVGRRGDGEARRRPTRPLSDGLPPGSGSRRR